MYEKMTKLKKKTLINLPEVNIEVSGRSTKRTLKSTLHEYGTVYPYLTTFIFKVSESFRDRRVCLIP